MTSVSYSFPHGLIETRVIIKWFYRLYCIVSHKIKCTNGKLTYILVNKMGTTLTEEYGTTTSTTSTTAAITNLLYLEPLPRFLSHIEKISSTLDTRKLKNYGSARIFHNCYTCVKDGFELNRGRT